MNHAMKMQEPEMESNIAKGDFTFIKEWLKKSVFDKGRLYTSEELCEQMTSEKLNDRYFLEYALDKFNDIYIQ